MKRFILQIVRRIKKWINYLSDHVLISSMFFLARSGGFPKIFEKMMKRIVYIIDDVAWLLRDFTRANVFKFTGQEWSVIFVGRDISGLKIVYGDYLNRVDYGRKQE